jgi:hypothetical protein
LRDDIPVDVVPYHVNDEEFARTVGAAVLELVEAMSLVKEPS